MKKRIATDVAENIEFLRKEFQSNEFDFHALFLYEEGRFRLRKKCPP